MQPSVRSIDVIGVIGSTGSSRTDVAAAEEPLEIRLGASPFVVIMRTPGADRELAAGFLLSEQVIQGARDVATIKHCTEGEGAELGNVLNVWLTGDAAERGAARLSERRLVTSTSSCGVCGRRSIDDLMRNLGAVPPGSGRTIPRDVIGARPARLRAAQAGFDESGGLHAAGLFGFDGSVMAVAEDIGRHNAVDKVVGAQVLTERLPLGSAILFVSGRTSFEIVQKAVVAGIPVVAAVSAPSTLAIDLARRANVTLLGFVRGNTFNIYSGAERIGL
jgi:FdhD protein